MNMQQLRYVHEVVHAGFSVSAAAARLHTSQPGISTQIRLLEEELQVQLFERRGKRLMGLTPAGLAVFEVVKRIQRDVENLRVIGREHASAERGTLSIATTHTQARYVLPPVVQTFTLRYPEVRLNIHQGNPLQIGEMAASGKADIAIATEALEHFEGLVMLPCYTWNRCIVTPPDHPLLTIEPLTLEALAEHPMVTYDDAFTGRSKTNQAFAARGLTPNVVLTALDSDVIKTYVELGLGVGLLATMAFDARRDAPLQMRDVGHLFAPSTTRLGLRRGAFVRGYLYAFITLFAPRLTRDVVEQALHD